MIKLLIASAFYLVSIYSLSYTSIDGASVNFSSYRGKKILIVNIATGSNKVNQLPALQQLYTKYKDSLVVIGFPSNSFGNEPRNNTEIKQFCKSAYNINFPLAQKVPVIGAGASPVFNWLSDQTQNGSMNTVIAKDFQKFLIDKDGTLIGVFSSRLSPMDSIIQNAITGN